GPLARRTTGCGASAPAPVGALLPSFFLESGNGQGAPAPIQSGRRSVGCLTIESENWRSHRERCADLVKQRVAEQRLLDQRGPGPRGGRADRCARLRRDQDRGRGNVTAPQLGQEIEPVHARQLVVEYETARIRERPVLQQ